MSAPIYLDRRANTLVDAIQYIKDDPRTHWHVNEGHSVIKALQPDIHWVETPAGAVLINDRDWVVQKPDNSERQVVADNDFQANIQPIAEVKLVN